MSSVPANDPPGSTRQPQRAQTTMYCTRCGQPNTSDARFCVACGQPLVAPVPAGAAPQPFAAPQIINTITVAAPTPAVSPVVVIGPQAAGPGLFVRGLYFLFIGCWLGALCTALAWALDATIIGLPLGIMILNRLPQIMTLKPAAGGMTVTVAGGAVVVQQGSTQQYSFLVRALYYVFVGWWLSGLWLLTAWSLLAMTMGLALPLSFWMFNRAPAVTTLSR
jgi:uncharacterized membrane protein YccF (DUF307 family)